MTNITATATVVLAAVVANATTIFDRLPGQAYDGTNDHLVKAHMVKVTNNEGMSKVCDVVDIRLAAGNDWHAIAEEGLVIEGTDGPVDNMKSLYWILNGLHKAGNSWEEIKASLYDAEESWI